MIRFAASILPSKCSLFCVAGILFLLAGCATSPRTSSRRTVREELPPPRTELVLLNVPEGSGWVAYRKQEQETDVEDYRIVVIRQSTNELIYDSVIPLAASVATHGFELAKDDPRLQELAQNVDQSIISPLERVVPYSPPDSPKTPSDEPSEDSIGDPIGDPTEVPTEDPIGEPAGPPEPALGTPPLESPTPRPTPESVPVEEAETLYPFLEQLEDSIRIGMPKDQPLSPGDRLFVREPDRVISLPGSQEQILVSKGTVTGLVKVDAVEDHVAHTLLLSGYLPEDPFFEVSEQK